MRLLPVVVAAALVATCAAADRLARGIAPGIADRLTFANRGRGRFAYLAVYPPKGVREATYTLRVAPAG